MLQISKSGKKQKRSLGSLKSFVEPVFLIVQCPVTDVFFVFFLPQKKVINSFKNSIRSNLHQASLKLIHLRRSVMAVAYLCLSSNGPNKSSQVDAEQSFLRFRYQLALITTTQWID